MPTALLVDRSVDSFTTLALISFALLAHMAWKVNLMTLTNDWFETSAVGSCSGLMAFGSGLGGVLFAGVAGIVVANHSYGTLFAVIAFLHPVALLILHGLTKDHPVKP